MKGLESSARTSQAKTQDVMMPSNLISANAEKIYPLHLALADVKMLVDRHLGSRRKKGGQAGRWHRGCHRLHAEFQSLRYCFDIQAGIDIICGKPMTAKVEDALELVKMQARQASWSVCIRFMPCCDRPAIWSEPQDWLDTAGACRICAGLGNSSCRSYI